MTYSLMEHQKVALAFMDMCDDGLLIAYDIGCGKTMIALEWIRRALNRGTISNALVICPASLVSSWKQAIGDCVNFGYDPGEIEMLERAITITSYQKTYRTDTKVLRFKDGSVYEKKEKVIRDEIDKEWDVIICDESHNLGGHSSVQTKTCIKLAKHAKRRFALSGTPLHGGGGKQDWCKMYGQIQFITGGQRWRSWYHFCKECVYSFDKWHMPRTWLDDNCEKVFKDYTISCRRDDCIDLPGYMETDIRCELAESKMYKDIRRGDISKYSITCEAAGTQYAKLLQVVSGSCITDTGTLELKCGKDEMLINILDGTDEKIVIFCMYKASIARCERICKDRGRDVVTFDGSSKTDTWREFRDGQRDTLVIQYGSGSEGLNLQNAHICVFYEPTLSALRLEQAAGRLYRQGQETKCLYYYLTTADTIEDKVWRVTRSGKDVNNEMLEQLAHGEL